MGMFSSTVSIRTSAAIQFLNGLLEVLRELVDASWLSASCAVMALKERTSVPNSSWP